MITVACVRTGTKYEPGYVLNLEAMVARHLKQPHRFVCLTDRPGDFAGIETIDISEVGLPGWWAKMALFELASKSKGRVLFFDLDMVICGSLDPLAALEVEFGVCANFTRAAGNKSWPCAYGSCVMSLAPGFGADIWRRFEAKRNELIMKAGHYGDQLVIEWLHPGASLLQDLLPENYFVGYRDLSDRKQDGCAVVVFAGRAKPHNTEVDWVRQEWR